MGDFTGNSGHEGRQLGGDRIKATVSPSRNVKIVKLKGLWKGLKVDDKDVERAKKSLFKHASA